MEIKTAAFAMMFIAMAMTVPTYAKEDRGVMPDSILYGIDTAIDNIRYAMTFNETQKAQIGLQIAEKRLLQVRDMILQNKTKESEAAEKEHDNILGWMKHDITKVDNYTADKIIQYQKKATEIRDNLTITIRGHLTSEQQRVIDTLIASMENQTAEIKIKAQKHGLDINVNQPRFLGPPVRENETDDERDNRGHDDNKTRGNDQAAATAMIAKAQATIAGCTTNPLLRNAQKHLEEAREAFAEGKYGEAFGQATAAYNNALDCTKPRDNNTSNNTTNNTSNNTVVPINGTVSGIVFDDKNGNGLRDSGDAGLFGWTIQLGSKTAITDENGTYSFTNLTAGTYTISEVVKDGWYNTTAPGSVTINQTTATMNFGNFRYGRVNGTVSFNETGLTGWTVKLDNRTTTTMANGYYQFPNLRAGTYNVSVVPEENWTVGSQLATITSGSVIELNFAAQGGAI